MAKRRRFVCSKQMQQDPIVDIVVTGDRETEEAGECRTIEEKFAGWHNAFDSGLPPVYWARGEFAPYILCNHRDCGMVVAPHGCNPDTVREMQREVFRIIHERRGHPIE